MEIVFELIFEIVLEGAVGVVGDKRVPIWIRILLGAFIITIVGGVIGLLIALGMRVAYINKGDAGAFFGGMLIILIGLVLLSVFIYKGWKFYQKHRLKDESDINQ